MVDVVNRVDLDSIFDEKTELSASRFIDALMDLLSLTIERAQEVLRRLVELGKVIVSNRYTVARA